MKKFTRTIGIIGLGKMGGGLALNLKDSKWKVVGYNRTTKVTDQYKKKGIIKVTTIEELIEKLPAPRIVWVMVSHGGVDAIFEQVVPLLSKGDILVDGGNSPYQETMRRSKDLAEKGIQFLDIGVSGGPGGVRNGACMMIGGDAKACKQLEALKFFKDTCLPEGWGYFGSHGAGHYVKMVHNGIEYGMMQSIAEGFDLMRHSKEFQLDMKKVTGVYSHGSVVTSRLVSWLSDAFRKYGADLGEISGKASASGEGQWTFEAGERDSIPMPAIKSSIDTRAASQKQPSYQGKVISAMRGEFGQHPVKRGDDEPKIL